ncbi:MAG: hypothetical protein QM539_07830 [Alphaproteobacteria bacterium]|nr:hypothetical protein [Alphaproteobacteria bacterium]
MKIMFKLSVVVTLLVSTYGLAFSNNFKPLYSTLNTPIISKKSLGLNKDFSNAFGIKKEVLQYNTNPFHINLNTTPIAELSNKTPQINDLPKISLNLQNPSYGNDKQYKAGKRLRNWGIALLSIGYATAAFGALIAALSYSTGAFVGTIFIAAPPIISGSLMLGFGIHLMKKAKVLKS